MGIGPCQEHSSCKELFIMLAACLMPAEPLRAFHNTLLQSPSLQSRQRIEELLVVLFSAKISTSKVQGNQVGILLKEFGVLLDEAFEIITQSYKSDSFGHTNFKRR